MRYEASPITTSCVSAIRRVRRRAKERILGFFCFMMQRYSKKAETQNFQHNYFQLCNRWEKKHYSTQKCGASPESSHSLGQMSHGLGKTRGGALYLRRGSPEIVYTSPFKSPSSFLSLFFLHISFFLFIFVRELPN